MIRAGYSDKRRIVDVLAASFNDNKSVNYIIKQDHKRAHRIRKLMEYAFDVCFLFGDVFITEDGNGCALILLPDKKKVNLKSILLDLKLITSCIGFSNIEKVMSREAAIKKRQSKELKYYLWFIGVEPGGQNKGTGTSLLKEVIQQDLKLNRIVCLETSTERNVPWYKKLGFIIYDEFNPGYRLFFMKKE